jgi:hypothetical protein
MVLKGADATLKKTWPALYLENDRRDQSPVLLSHLAALGYETWWHLPPLFSPDNHRGKTENVFGVIRSVNVLGLHRSRGQGAPSGVELVKVANTNDWLLP